MPDTHHRKVTDEAGIAEVLDISRSFVRKDRRGKRLIPFFRIGDLIRYDVERVLAALQAYEEGGPQKATRARRAPAVGMAPAAVTVPALAVEAPPKRARGRPPKALVVVPAAEATPSP